MNEESATITLTIDGRPTRVLLDTGARINVMDVRSMKGQSKQKHVTNKQSGNENIGIMRFSTVKTMKGS